MPVPVEEPLHLTGTQVYLILDAPGVRIQVEGTQPGAHPGGEERAGNALEQLATSNCDLVEAKKITPLVGVFRATTGDTETRSSTGRSKKNGSPASVSIRVPLKAASLAADGAQVVDILDTCELKCIRGCQLDPLIASGSDKD